MTVTSPCVKYPAHRRPRHSVHNLIYIITIVVSINQVNINRISIFFSFSDGTVEWKRTTLAVAHRAQPSSIVTKLAVGRIPSLPDRFSGSQHSSYDDHTPSAISGVGQYHSHGTIEW